MKYQRVADVVVKFTALRRVFMGWEGLNDPTFHQYLRNMSAEKPLP